MSSAIRPDPHFRVGDWVSFLYGPKKVRAQVVEDRGLLGVGGRRLYRVRLDLEHGQPSTFELPEEDLEAAEAPAEANPLLDAPLNYLSQGKQFTQISPEKFTKSRRRRVVFHFADGTEEEQTFESSPATFMRWWKDTSAYLRRMADAFQNPTGS